MLRAWLANLFRRNRSKKPVRDVVGNDNVIEYEGATLLGVEFHIHGDRNRIRIGQHSRINGLIVRIHGNGHTVVIGESCVFNEGGTIWIEDEGSRLSIGNGTTIEFAEIAITEAGSKVTIGADCLISYDVDIRTGDSHSILDGDTAKRFNYAEDVLIADHVWIGARCAILKGSVISSETVVGTGSVVTGKFAETGVVLAGNPARIVKSNVRWLRERLPRTSA